MIALALNGGSSSLKYALFDGEDVIVRGLRERTTDLAAALGEVVTELDGGGHARPDVIGHRIVHGGPEHQDPAVVDSALVAALEAAIPFAPLHLPSELALLHASQASYAGIPHVTCFDTGFHRTLPPVARHFALPARLHDAGVRRYGFHGLSYEYIVSALDPAHTRRAVIAHLGSGASLAAIRNGESIDTTMGLTPTGGIAMGTRTGDLDPGVILHLLDSGHDAAAVRQLVDHDGGLKGLSGTTSDMQALLAARATDPRAALAIDVFCYQARKAIGAFAAALGGLEDLVFTGGIGEHAETVRAQICDGLGYLEPLRIHVVATDEERMIARHALRLAT